MEGLEITFDVVSYTLIALIAGVLVVPLFFQRDPDVHPFALLNQSNVSALRNPGESAIYRSPDTPHGYPLVAGLGLPAEQKYQTRPGDLRDIWKLAVEKGTGKILSVKGRDVETHTLQELSKHIYNFGSHLSSIGATSVALYLPNDTENLVVSFACAFYGIHLIILPFEPSGCPDLEALLASTKADVIVAAAGQVPLNAIQSYTPKEVIYVVEPGSQHLDFTSTPGAVPKSVVYHEIVSSGSAQDPQLKLNIESPTLTIFSPLPPTGPRELTRFSHRNLVAGIAAQIRSLPKAEQYTPGDVVAPVDTLADLYTRTHVYAALLSGSTIALSSIAGRNANLEPAVRNVNPTVIIASPETLHSIHGRTRGGMMEIWHGLIHYFQTRTLTRSGCIPKGNFLTRFNDYIRPDVGTALRLVFVAETAGSQDSQHLTSLDLSDLRVFLKAKVVYALKHWKVAGFVAQGHVYDYRVKREEGKDRCASFGIPSPALEVKLRDLVEKGFTAEDKEGPRGEVVVSGPSVAGGSGGPGRGVGLGFVGRWEREGVLSYA